MTQKKNTEKDNEKNYTNRKQREYINEISQEEIDQTINKLRKGKAPGPEELGNEVWIRGGKELRKKLKKLLNGGLKGDPIPVN